MRRRAIIGAATAVVAALAVTAVVDAMRGDDSRTIRIAIAPYQDLAMIVNAVPLGLDQKRGKKLEVVTMSWEEILPAVASAGRTVDVGFGSLIEYLTKYEHLNAGSSDPVLFIYPAYVFKGGGFVSFRKDVPDLGSTGTADPKAVQAFLAARIGAQKGSVYEMMLFRLAQLHPSLAKPKLIDTPLDHGFLAAEQGSLDIASAGLTQLTETSRRGGRQVLTMDNLGFADITGFIVKRSFLEKRRSDLEAVIGMWFESVDHVFSNVDANSQATLDYLNKNASTRYTLAEFKRALGAEYLPRSLKEADEQLVQTSGKFPARSIAVIANEVLMSSGTVRTAAPVPDFSWMSAR